MPVPGGRPDPTCLSGLEYRPCPIWGLSAFFPSPLPQGHLPAAWKQSGTWHLGGSGGKSTAVLGAEPQLQGTGGAAHLAGRNPNLPEAVENRPGPGERPCLPRRPQALCGTRGLSHPRLGAKAHGEQAGTSCCRSDRPLVCRLHLATRHVCFSTTRPLSPAKVHADHWTTILKIPSSV